MTIPAGNQVRHHRMEKGWTQEQLAGRAGISRTAVSAIEGERLVPSVAAALALAETLGCTVERLFGRSSPAPACDVWAWEPSGGSSRCWRAEVSGKTVLYPAASTPMLTPLPDNAASANSSSPEETLVIACCDPAAGLLASQFFGITGLRLLVIPRSSRQALDMLKNGLVHMAGLHYATKKEPERNTQIVRETLGAGFEMVRVARWQEGIAVSHTEKLRSVTAARKANLTWIGREPGSGAQQCLDRLLDGRPGPRLLARHHRGVADAVQSGWADAGICVQLASAEAGLDFLPVQEEAYDLCFAAALADDRRIKSFLKVVRSAAYHRILGELPGYDACETGNVWAAN